MKKIKINKIELEELTGKRSRIHVGVVDYCAHVIWIVDVALYRRSAFTPLNFMIA